MQENCNKKIAGNSILLYIDLIASALLWFIASRYLLEALGVRDFGLYNVVGGIVVLLNVLNTAMISTSYRYIATEIGKNEGNPNLIFNVCKVIHLSIALLIVILGMPLGFYYIDNFLNVESSNISAAKFVYTISIITCAVSTYTIPYLGLITANENFRFKVIVNIIRGLIRFVLVIILLFINGDRLKTYAIFALIPEVIVAISYILYSNKKHKKITNFIICRQRDIYMEMCKFASWVLFGSIAKIGKNQGASLLVNYFFGTILNASLAISNTVNSFVSTATSSLTQAASPQITKSFSGGNSNRSLDIAIYISKYSFIMMLIVCVPIITQTDFILNIWLKNVPEYTSIFVKLILIDALISCFGAGISTLYEAHGRIRPFQISTSIILLSSVLLGYIGYCLNLPPYSLLIIYCIMSLIDRIVACILLKFILKISISRLITFSYLNSIKLSLLVIPLYIINVVASNVHPVILIAITEILLLITVYYLGLNKFEREYVTKAVTVIKGKIFR